MSLRFLATSEQIQPSGDNYRLKRLNPAGYRFHRPIIGPKEAFVRTMVPKEAASAMERPGGEGRTDGAELAFVSDLRGHPYERVSRTSDHRR